jgi:hypothetical protein
MTAVGAELKALLKIVWRLIALEERGESDPELAGQLAAAADLISHVQATMSEKEARV